MVAALGSSESTLLPATADVHQEQKESTGLLLGLHGTKLHSPRPCLRGGTCSAGVQEQRPPGRGSGGRPSGCDCAGGGPAVPGAPEQEAHRQVRACSVCLACLSCTSPCLATLNRTGTAGYRVEVSLITGETQTIAQRLMLCMAPLSFDCVYSKACLGHLTYLVWYSLSLCVSSASHGLRSGLKHGTA